MDEELPLAEDQRWQFFENLGKAHCEKIIARVGLSAQSFLGWSLEAMESRVFCISVPALIVSLL